MATSDLLGDEPPAPWASLRRQQDRIVPLDARVRALLLGTGTAGGTGPLTFTEAVGFAAALTATELGEALVEVWLRDMPPWGAGTSQALLPIAGATAFGRLRLRAPTTPPDDLMLAVVTAGRALRFDDAASHPLVRAWAAGAGVAPAGLAAFVGYPVRHRGQILGVLAAATTAIPSPDHTMFLDTLADYLAAGAHEAHQRHFLQAQREMAQAVLREAPLAAAVVTPGDNIIVLTNPRFDQLFNIGPDVWGQRLDAALPDHAHQLRRALRLDDVTRFGETRVMFDLTIRLPDGLTYWDITCAPLHAASGAIDGILIAGVEMTPRVVQRQRQQRAVDIAQERVAQMITLHQVALAVAGQLDQDPFALLRQIVEKMAALFDATGGMVYYALRETNELEVVVSTGLSKDFTGIRLSQGEGLSGRVAISGQGQWVNEYRRYVFRASVFADEPFGAVAAVPMKHRGRVIGVICLVHELPRDDAPPRRALPDDEERTEFTAEDIWVLELFANQAALVIETARTYQDLERAYQQQRALGRQKDDFLARASHDLRLPLTSIIGFLDLALETLHRGDDVQAMVQQVADEAQRLNTMMDELLAQSQQESSERGVQLRPTRLAPVIDEVVGARRKQATLHGTAHRFIVGVPADLAVQADLTRLKEVLENLLSNAVKYSPRGGDITIEARAQPDGRAVVMISDEGIGIPPEAHTRIFDRFTRVESPLASEIRGTGVGLYLAQQLIGAMGGALWLERSAPGEGSTFAFALPLAGG